MNLWNTGPFDNDSAKEFLQEVQDDGAFALQEALEVVLDPDLEYLEAEEAARAIAAAELVRVILTGDTATLTDAGMRAWVQQARAKQAGPESLEPLRLLAQQALRRVLEPESELPDLWAERQGTKGAADWQAGIQHLLASLTAG